METDQETEAAVIRYVAHEDRGKTVVLDVLRHRFLWLGSYSVRYIHQVGASYWRNCYGSVFKTWIWQDASGYVPELGICEQLTSMYIFARSEAEALDEVTDNVIPIWKSGSR